MRFLIIEDDFVSITKLKTLLSKYAECDIATNASQAFQKVSDMVEAGQCYDAMLIDINLPDMNGLDLVKTINQKEATCSLPRAKKIVVTAEGSLMNVKKAAEYKCDSFLVKPTRKEILLQKLASVGIKIGDDQREKVKELQRRADVIVNTVQWNNRKVTERERFVMRQEIRQHKRDIFRMCTGNPKMMLLLDAIVEDELWREFGE